MGNSTKIIPVLPPPQGVQSNWVNPENQKDAMIATHTICLFFVTLCVCIRLYTRRCIVGKLGLDDYFAILSFALTITFSALQITADVNGLGRHAWDIPRQEFPNAMKPFAIGILVYNLLQMSVKLTCLTFYRHIFHPTHKTLLFVNAGIAFVLVSYISIVFAVAFECRPIQRMWNKAIPGHCFKQQGLAYTGAGVNAVSDLYILLVPIPAVLSLPLSKGRKFRILTIFGLGIFACATSVIRIVMMVQEYRSIDFTWNATRIGIFSILEVDVGLCCGCLFVFPVFIKHYKHCFARFLPSRMGGSSRMTYGGTETKSEFRSSSWPQRNRSDELNLNSADSTTGTSRTSTRHTHDDEAMRYNTTRPLEPE